ncbi:tRNA pseudouridine(38-40) synthase TruA [Colwellia sp. D2M02]|uniref:tRNA pseudouridine(38-40) synthase TruA n=1 Tax=Colwellia sp. D2M02 TaxID=2841562 RepID=UPI001C08159A|nr:tRNA pseudouridine(38-40) synthase TruA [Colwellia sp. D2M02]MBU2893918.1 tRNA pseudouridine(38-40) synthase TruA [Colwellia sp. D2M02]
MRYALGVQYDGKHYCGWQRQNNVITVQEKLEKALSTIANEKIEVVCAGRTDTGVNATNQVVHFDTNATRKDVAWTLGANTHLPPDIAISWAREVDDEFHARFSATARRYRYIIYNHPLRSAILSHGISHWHHELDAELMHDAAQHLIGRHDFTSFRTVHCQSHSPVRTIEHCQVFRQGKYIIVDIKANAFLHHMVRNVVGSLFRVGQKQESIAWIQEVLLAKNRCLAGVTAPPEGLYFVDVDYPSQFKIPKQPLGPLFL